MLTDVSIPVGTPCILPLEVVIGAEVDASLPAIRDIAGGEVGEDVPDTILPAAGVVLRLDATDPEVSVRVVRHQSFQETLQRGMIMRVIATTATTANTGICIITL